MNNLEWPMIQRQADRLMEGNREFRFLGLCASTLNMTKEQILADWSNRWPTEFEIRDLFDSLRRMGARATRIGIGLSVACEKDGHVQTHLQGRRRYNETAFKTLDLVLALAREYDVRIIFPFIASQSFTNTRGVDEFAAFAGLGKGDFWTDPGLKADFKHLIDFILLRKNTVSGLIYKDDPAILAWQFGNEFDSYAPDRSLDSKVYAKEIFNWTVEMAAHLRSVDPQHLIMEAGGAPREALLAAGALDICSTHLYEYWSRVKNEPWEMAPMALEQRQALRGRFPLIIDELGLASYDNLRSLLETIRSEGISGGLLWGIRGHREAGGWYYHNEGGTPVNSYHIPGFAVGAAYEEIRTLDLLKSQVWQIRGEAMPAVSPPTGQPILHRLEAGLTWCGCSGAEYYDLEVADNAAGPWKTARTGLHDSVIADVKAHESAKVSAPTILYYPEGSTAGQRCYYRLRAVNSAGATPWSEPLQVQY